MHAILIMMGDASLKASATLYTLLGSKLFVGPFVGRGASPLWCCCPLRRCNGWGGPVSLLSDGPFS